MDMQTKSKKSERPQPHTKNYSKLQKNETREVVFILNEHTSGFFVQLHIVNSETYTKLALYGLKSLYLGIYVCTHIHAI